MVHRYIEVEDVDHAESDAMELLDCTHAFLKCVHETNDPEAALEAIDRCYKAIEKWGKTLEPEVFNISGDQHVHVVSKMPRLGNLKAIGMPAPLCVQLALLAYRIQRIGWEHVNVPPGTTEQFDSIWRRIRAEAMKYPLFDYRDVYSRLRTEFHFLRQQARAGKFEPTPESILAKCESAIQSLAKHQPGSTDADRKNVTNIFRDLWTLPSPCPRRPNQPTKKELADEAVVVNSLEAVRCWCLEMLEERPSPNMEAATLVDDMERSSRRYRDLVSRVWPDLAERIDDVEDSNVIGEVDSRWEELMATRDSKLKFPDSDDEYICAATVLKLPMPTKSPAEAPDEWNAIIAGWCLGEMRTDERGGCRKCGRSPGVDPVKEKKRDACETIRKALKTAKSNDAVAKALDLTIPQDSVREAADGLVHVVAEHLKRKSKPVRPSRAKANRRDKKSPDPLFVAFLLEHHGYEAGRGDNGERCSVANREPASLKQIGDALSCSRSTAHRRIKQAFVTYENYKIACRGPGLGAWLMGVNGDNLKGLALGDNSEQIQAPPE